MKFKLKITPQKIVYSLFGYRIHYHRVAAVIVAGGNGTRMGDSDKVKHLLSIDGVPVLAKSLLAFQNTSSVGYIILVTRKEDITECKQIIKKYNITKVAAITTGGKTRQESVIKGIFQLDKRTNLVAIHDAARCLVTPDMIKKVINCAKKTGAASAGVPVKDTIKEVDDNGIIVATPKRENLWQAQTPQIFDAGLYRAAALYVKKKGISVTDDNSIVEAVGRKVTMVDCGYSNIKITTPEDIKIAESIIEEHNL